MFVNKQFTSLIGLNAGLLSLALVTTAQATSFQLLRASDFADPGVTRPKKIDIGGISQDGSTLFGSINIDPDAQGTSAKYNSAFYYRDGHMIIFNAAGDSALHTTVISGVSADGRTAIAKLDPYGGQQYITHFGLANQTADTMTAPGGYDTFNGSGPSAYSDFTRRHGLSADGSLVGGVASTSSNSKVDQTVWLASTGAAQLVNTSGLFLPTTAGAAQITSVAGNGSAFVGQSATTSNRSSPNQIFRETVGGTPEILRSGINNTGAALVDGFAMSNDGNTVLVRGGFWRENTANQDGFQNFQSIPGYNATFSYGGTVQHYQLASSTLVGMAMTPDASWAAGGSNGLHADPTLGNLSPSSGWIYSAATGQTYDVIDFLVAHGIDTSNFLSADGSYNYAPFTVTGLALSGDQLTLAGNTNSASGQASWFATVTVPEPTLSVVMLSVLGLLGARRRF